MNSLSVPTSSNGEAIANYQAPRTQTTAGLKVLQIFNFYDGYLDKFYLQNPDLAQAPFAEQIEALRRDGFGGFHVFAPFLVVTKSP